MHVKKGDTVEVLSGKDRGKQGRVVNVWPARAMVLVEGVNQVKRHERVQMAQGRGGTTGGIITKDMPVHASNLAVVCDSCGRGSRVGHEQGPEGKFRVCRRCGARL
ncbi:MAG TPA: 50S ribosomal protein L24 [Actinomycetota bacterium]